MHDEAKVRLLALRLSTVPAFDWTGSGEIAAEEVPPLIELVNGFITGKPAPGVTREGACIGAGKLGRWIVRHAIANGTIEEGTRRLNRLIAGVVEPTAVPFENWGGGELWNGPPVLATATDARRLLGDLAARMRVLGERGITGALIEEGRKQLLVDQLPPKSIPELHARVIALPTLACRTPDQDPGRLFTIALVGAIGLMATATPENVDAIPQMLEDAGAELELVALVGGRRTEDQWRDLAVFATSMRHWAASILSQVGLSRNPAQYAEMVASALPGVGTPQSHVPPWRPPPAWEAGLRRLLAERGGAAARYRPESEWHDPDRFGDIACGGALLLLKVAVEPVSGQGAGGLEHAAERYALLIEEMTATAGRMEAADLPWGSQLGPRDSMSNAVAGSLNLLGNARLLGAQTRVIDKVLQRLSDAQSQLHPELRIQGDGSTVPAHPDQTRQVGGL